MSSESIGLFLNRISRAWRRRTPKEFLALAAYNISLLLHGTYGRKDEIYDLSFDRTYGTDTLGREEAEYLAPASTLRSHARGYEPVSARRLHALMSHLPPIRYEDYCFIDYGSGKGRGLLLASSYPFRAIVGVEYSEVLHATAMRNISVYRSAEQRCFNISSICCDASTFNLPDGPILCFLYNPFDEHLMARTERTVSDSLAVAPRDFYLMYLNAAHTKPFAESPHWHSVKHGEIEGMPFAIWRWRQDA